ncbi:hypothetical protein B0A50_07649 [Salinomyces thailandicus]|uniref:Glycosyltransferase 2-like domain-containing protein n=1 Tax=Salinomyces thailandicus TaxID=706561 RepID=A0A4U0TL58_9PEZI|nr:hypothetical protein B0A50_07649 [Salinomyces thailandica]
MTGRPSYDGGKNGYVDVAVSEEQPLPPRRPRPKKMSLIQRWTPTALLLSYFVFSIAFYTVLDDYSRKVFWFLYLAIAFLVAGTTCLEAYDGLAPLREARNAVAKAENDGWKFKTPDEELPILNLIFDMGEQDVAQAFREIIHLLRGVTYPAHKMVINLLQQGNDHASVDYIGNDTSNMARIVSVPAHAAASISARTAYCLALDAPGAATSLTAIFSGDERPHPHAIRRAAERLIQDKKVDIVQGRTVLIPQKGFLSTFASLQQDMFSALLMPGRSVTWSLSYPSNTNVYWRTDALHGAATASGLVSSTGNDLGFTALARKARTSHDLKVISYLSPQPGFVAFWHANTRMAREYAMATTRYTTLAFKGLFQRHKGENQPDPSTKWSLKTRFAILWTLPVMRLVSHAILQYFCMAWAILFIDTPSSTADFARTIYYPYPISEWLLVGGCICILATVGMLYKARSEFVPLWTFPITLVLYPLLVVFRFGDLLCLLPYLGEGGLSIVRRHHHQQQQQQQPQHQQQQHQQRQHSAS